MAVGFRLSKVVDMKIVDAEMMIEFSTQTLRYEVIFDDPEKRKLIIEALKRFKDPVPINEKKRERPHFYLEDEKTDGLNKGV